MIMSQKRKLGWPIFSAVLLWMISCNISSSTSTAAPGIAPTPTVQETLSAASTDTPGLGAIYGVLWHDTCDFSGGEGGEPVVLGTGCVQWGSQPEEFGPNQVYDDFETGWAGVTLHLGLGACPSTGLATAVTNASGKYRFDGLEAGTYCVSYSALTDGNDTILIPGEPTYPQRGDAGYSQTMPLGSGEEKEANFGFAWQFYN
jgi:hypothetical protein